MVSHMSYTYCVACRPGCRPCRVISSISCGSMDIETRRPRLAYGDLSPRPCPCCVDCLLRPAVLRVLIEEQRQHVLRALRSPGRKQTMPIQVKRTATMGRLEAPVSHETSIYVSSPSLHKAVKSLAVTIQCSLKSCVTSLKVSFFPLPLPPFEPYFHLGLRAAVFWVVVDSAL